MRDYVDDVPRHRKQGNRKRKHFGIEYYTRWFKRWTLWKWYLTEEQRDQALAMLIKHTNTVYKRPGNPPPEDRYRKVERK